MAAGMSRPTTKLDPKELLGLVSLSAGREQRPTCQMPKLELASLLHDPAMAQPAIEAPPAPCTTVLDLCAAPVVPPRSLAAFVARCVLAIAVLVVMFAVL